MTDERELKVGHVASLSSGTCNSTDEPCAKDKCIKLESALAEAKGEIERAKVLDGILARALGALGADEFDSADVLARGRMQELGAAKAEIKRLKRERDGALRFEDGPHTWYLDSLDELKSELLRMMQVNAENQRRANTADQRAESAERALAALREQTDHSWQPIETAEKNTDLWCWDRVEGYYHARLIEVTEFLGVGKGSRPVWRWHNKSANRYSNPTHWMPLPAITPASSVPSSDPERA